MSIIADTLKRLQTQSEEPPATVKSDMSSRPVFNKAEGAGRHRKDSPFGFLIVMVGMTITLGSLAVAGFWIGGHLDFGLATNTQARVNDPLMLTNGPDLLEDPVSVHQSSESDGAVSPEPIQFPQSPTTPPTNEQGQASASLGPNHTPVPPLPAQQVATPSRFEIETDNPLSTNAKVTTAAHVPEDRFHSIVHSSSHTEKSTARPLSISEEHPSGMISTDLPPAPQEDPTVDLGNANQREATEDPILVAMSLKEEMIQTEKIVKTNNLLPDSASRLTTPKALNPQQESMNHDDLTTAPSPPTQPNRLRHAQELIRSGEYEGAVALLSPLFHDPPVKWQPWFWMGTALLGQGDTEQADQFFLSGLARNDKVPQLWIQRALVAQQRGDYQLAIHELRQAETLEADLPHIHLNMGYAYEQLGNDRLANQYYGKFLKLSEDQPAFFSTRKKLFARLTQQSPTEQPQPLSSSIP